MFAKLNARAQARANDNRVRKSHTKTISDDASCCSTTSLGSSLTNLDLSSGSLHSALSSGSLHSASDIGEKSVSFKRRMNKTIEVEFICDIDDIDDHWYTSEDFQAFKVRDKALLQKLRSSTSSAEEMEKELGDCTRGLEREQPEMKRRTHAHKKECYAVVLKEGQTAEEIARAHSRSTRSSTRDASIIARLDAMAAKEFTQ
ncbi:MAG: hypothetical protein SGILL_000482 [Bacillariaceae sp.]